MNARDLRSIISKDLHMSLKVHGIYAVDSLASTAFLKLGQGLIVNVDKWGEAGIHWVCCFHSSRPGEFEFFDAEGEPPQYYSRQFKEFLSGGTKDIVYNRKVLQANGSNMCEAYALYYLYYRCRGYKMAEILSHFSNQCIVNDLIVKTFIQNIE